MSYILDALKKSEKERQRGQVPDLLTGQDTVPPGTKRRVVWPYLLLAALLLNAALLLLWKYPSQPKKTNESGPSKIIQQQPLPLKTAPAVTNIAKKVPEAKDTKKKKAVASKTVTPEQPSKSKARAAFDLLGRAADKPLQAEAPKVPAVATPALQEAKQTGRVSVGLKHATESPAAAAAPGKKIYRRDELPASVQKGLPDFNITVSIYSDNPAARLIKVNGETLREGESLSSGLKLEEILQNGAVMSYQNYRFHIGLR